MSAENNEAIAGQEAPPELPVILVRWDPRTQCPQLEFDPTEFKSCDMVIGVLQSTLDFMKFQRQVQWSQNAMQLLQQQAETNMRAAALAGQRKAEIERLTRQLRRE